jgi:anti-sigma B factor antagonist
MDVDKASITPIGQSRQEFWHRRRGHVSIVGRRTDRLCHSRRVDFTVSSSEIGNRTVVTAQGELDAHSAPTLQGQLDPLTAVSGALVVIDLSAVGFIDSTGLGVLVSTLKHVREVNGRLDVVVSSPRVLKVFTLTGLNAVIPLHATLDEALAAG